MRELPRLLEVLPLGAKRAAIVTQEGDHAAFRRAVQEMGSMAGDRKDLLIIMLTLALGVGALIMLAAIRGIGTPLVFIPSIIGIIEGIMYLTKSDEEFVQTYIVGIAIHIAATAIAFYLWTEHRGERFLQFWALAWSSSSKSSKGSGP